MPALTIEQYVCVAHFVFNCFKIGKHLVREVSLSTRHFWTSFAVEISLDYLL